MPGFGQRFVPVECTEIPEAIAEPTWLPDNFTLPEGSYAVLDMGNQSGFHRGVFAAPIDYRDFRAFVADDWASEGWILARDENEPGEAEAAFVRDRQVGAFRARQSYCDESWSEILIILGPP